MGHPMRMSSTGPRSMSRASNDTHVSAWDREIRSKYVAICRLLGELITCFVFKTRHTCLSYMSYARAELHILTVAYVCLFRSPLALCWLTFSCDAIDAAIEGLFGVTEDSVVTMVSVFRLVVQYV